MSRCSRPARDMVQMRKTVICAMMLVLLAIAACGARAQRDNDDDFDDAGFDDSGYNQPQNHDAEGSNQNPSNYSPANEDSDLDDDDDADETQHAPQVADQQPDDSAQQQAYERDDSQQQQQQQQQQQDQPSNSYYANVQPQRFYATPNSVLVANVDPSAAAAAYNGHQLRYRRSVPLPRPKQQQQQQQPEADIEDDVRQLTPLVRHKRHSKHIGPVYTYVKTDKHAHYKWGVKHKVGKKHG